MWPEVGDPFNMLIFYIDNTHWTIRVSRLPEISARQRSRDRFMTFPHTNGGTESLPGILVAAFISRSLNFSILLGFALPVPMPRLPDFSF